MKFLRACFRVIWKEPGEFVYFYAFPLLVLSGYGCSLVSEASRFKPISRVGQGLAMFVSFWCFLFVLGLLPTVFEKAEKLLAPKDEA